jgi:flavin reductase (DIM6/NTAB) family NADH-FMN oxidoreductase RutF
MAAYQEDMTPAAAFTQLSRQAFRKYFQPSRILLGIVPAPTESGINVLTLCFTMYCSYKPPMLAVAIHNINASYELFGNTGQYVLAVPGESMVEEIMFCGTKSMRQVPDKATHLNLDLISSVKVGVPGLAKAIANVEMVKHSSLRTGDHLLVVGEAVSFRVRQDSPERPLLSVGPNALGYRVLAHKGIHRIAVVSPPVAWHREHRP